MKTLLNMYNPDSGSPLKGERSEQMEKRRYIDLSIAIEHDLPSDPEITRPKIEYRDHEAGAREMTESFFQGLDKAGGHCGGRRGQALSRTNNPFATRNSSVSDALDYEIDAHANHEEGAQPIDECS
jgi:hypothetical protein